MGRRDPRVDAYIEKSAAFAQPILKHLRELVHRECPEVEETLKWSMPSFVYKGILCGMAAFKHHAAFHFWKHKVVVGETANKEAMGQFGRIGSLKDLPSDAVLLRYIRKAAKLNQEGIKSPARMRSKPSQNRELTVPDYLLAVLRKNASAKSNFENFSYSHKKEYVEWLTEARREETRKMRLETALVWITEGKPRNWKYMRC